MRKIIRCRPCRKFLAEDGSWTTDLSSARAFATDLEIRVAVERISQHVELYYSFRQNEVDEEYDFVVRLGKSHSSTADTEASQG